MQLRQRDLKAGQAALPRAEHVAFAAQAQIFFGNAEAIFGFAQNGKPRLGGFAKRRLVKQQTGRGAGAAADAAAQLMQLCEPEAFGVLDHHDGCFRHIDADLDHGRGDEELGLAGSKTSHGGIFIGALHAAMHEVDLFAELFAQLLEARLRRGEVDFFGFIDQGTDPIGALALARARGRPRLPLLRGGRAESCGYRSAGGPGGFSRSSEISMSPK